MAPRPPPSEKKPSARAMRMQRITGQIHPLAPSKTHRPDALVDDSFLSSKRDKRMIKSSSFVSRIHSTASSRIAKKSSNRTRRPKNKLAASLDALADALPDVEEGGAENSGKVQHKSLRTRKGALKRKERIVKGEMERFGASMAKLADLPADEQKQKPLQENKEEQEMTDSPAPSNSNRWATLRGYISATMEQNPAFANK